MRFQNAATLFSLASLAQAAPHSHGDHHVKSQQQNGQAYESGVFYTNWAMYGRKHFVTDIPAEKFTKINYGFANVNNVTGEVFLSDVWADVQFPYPGDKATNGSQLLGNLNQLYKLKQKYRNLKTTISVGGWTFRNNFKPALATAEGRQKFCDSSLALITDLGLDGFDIDWEYPADTTDATNFVDTLKRCREAYDAYSAKHTNNYHFEIGISAPAGPQRYSVLPIADMDKYVDNWNLMAFDYQGPGFSNFTGHLSNVYASKTNPKSTDGWNSDTHTFVPFNTKDAIDYYKPRVASPCKIHLGMPLYGRSFANVIDLSTDGKAMGQQFNGSGDGTWEPGTLDYNVLPQNGSVMYSDKAVMAAWSWDKRRKQLVTFDTPKVAVWKTEYLKEQGLGGAWWWESNGDRKSSGPDSIVSTVVNQFGGVKKLKRNQNNLRYPTSKYYNIRDAGQNATASYKW